MGLSKFQIITIVFLFMFVFVIGAIYSNTKDAAESKMRQNNNINHYEAKNTIRNEETVIREDNSQIQNLSEQINYLNQKIHIHLSLHLNL